MATVTQIYQLVNDAAKEALGSKAITVKDAFIIKFKDNKRFN